MITQIVMNGSIGVYLRGDKLFIHPQLYAGSGGLRFSEPVFALNIEDDPSIIGQTALKTFTYCRDIEPPTGKYDMNFLKPLFKAAKVRSYTDFTRGAKYCSISVVEDKIQFDITKNAGPGKGFFYIPEKNFHYPFAEMSDPQKIGEEIFKVLALCE
jgi:hypothetical protein